MPRELIALEPRKPVLREYEEPELGCVQIRIRTEFASPKHGTEMVGYRNEPSASGPTTPSGAAVIPRPGGEGPRNFPLGNMAVGVVTEVGSRGDALPGWGPGVRAPSYPRDSYR